MPPTDLIPLAAARHGLVLEAVPEGRPPELPSNHPLIRLACAETGRAAITVPFGTDASELSAIAPRVIVGPGDIGQAHCPAESLSLVELEDAVPRFTRLARAV